MVSKEIVPHGNEDLNGAWSWLRQRMGWFMQSGGWNFQGRNLWQQFGYPELISLEDYWRMYKRNGIAFRVLSAFPRATWAEVPQIGDDAGYSDEEKTSTGEKNENYSKFTASVSTLLTEFRVMAHLERADRISAIGRFGILVMGFANGKMIEPLGKGKNKLLFLASYSERDVTVQQWETDTSSERYGMPVVYAVRAKATAPGQMPSNFYVHYTRVIHLAEHLDNNEVFSIPGLEPIYNWLLDLEKLVGSSNETFYLNARPGTALSVDKDAELTPQALKDMKSQAEEFENSLRRIMTLRGATATPLNAPVADPKSNADMLISLIAGAKGIPQRILIGSERGELASSQDENNWAAITNSRQKQYATPFILRPFLEIMIDTGNVIEPSGELKIEWNDANALAPDKQAEIAERKSNTLKNYLFSPGAEEVVPPQEFRQAFLDLPPTSEYATEEAPLDETDSNVADPTGDPSGERFQRDTVPAPTEPAQPADGKTPAAPPKQTVAVANSMRRLRARMNMEPKPLYAFYPVTNAPAIRDWYKANGLGELTSAGDMHVTVCYSKQPIDWMMVEPNIWCDDKGMVHVPPGGPRVHDMFGPAHDTLVLRFSSWALNSRWSDFVRAGASWDFDEFSPHITLAIGYAGDPADVPMYQGAIELGPETFQDLNPDWKDTRTENSDAPRPFRLLRGGRH